MSTADNSAVKLSQYPLFADIPEGKLSAIEKGSEIRILPAHTTVFRQGEPGDSFFIIHSGKVRIFRKSPSGSVREVAQLGSGDSFGELALITGETRFGYVETLEETQLTVIHKDQFERILKDHPHILSALIKKVSGMLYQSNASLEVETERGYTEAEEIMNKLDKLYIAGSWLHSTLDFREVLNEISDMIINLIGAKSLAIFLLNDKTNELAAVIAKGLRLDSIPKVEIGKGILGKVAETGQRCLSENIADTSTSNIDPASPIACIPLKIQDHVMGIIAIYSLYMKKAAFTDKDYELFDLLARHASTAVFSSGAYTSEKKARNLSWHDYVIIFCLSLVFSIVFNLSNPNGIRMIPKSWSNESLPVATPHSAIELFHNGEALFIDAMPPGFFEREHIRGAVNLPPALFDILYMLELSETDTEKQIFVYGRTISSRYDEEVARKLILRGHRNTRILEGGISGWKKSGYPVGP
jgi:CRP-like cAMP-binding protein/rhodanese-related sulfurtransferase/putative methionine-R-sulfoxide reductase with GAF domain